MSNVFPALRARDAGALIDFLERAFGFERHFVVPGENGAIEHSQIRCNGAGMVMIGSEREGDRFGSNAGQTWVYVVIDDPDAHHDRAKAAGAEIVMELTDQEYGSRGFAAPAPPGDIPGLGA